MLLGRSLGFYHRGDLLFYTAARCRDWSHWAGSAHAVFRFRFISLVGVLSDPGVLWLVKKRNIGIGG